MSSATTQQAVLSKINYCYLMKKIISVFLIVFYYSTKERFMRKIIITIAATLFAFSVNAKAEGVKFGIDYLMLNSEVDILDFDTSAIQLRVSNELNPYFDLEGVLAFGVSDDTYTESDPLAGTASITGQLGNMFGVFAKLHSDSSSPFQIFGKVGLVMVEYDLDFFIDSPGLVGSASQSYDDTGIAFGAGASFNITDKVAVAAEYSMLPDVDFEGLDIETDVIGVGIQMSF
jgi:opacity protein-like surface antigen